MSTSIASRACVLVTAVVVLTGGAILRGGAAAADPNQDEQFGALLDEADIPSQANLPSLIATAHKVCGKLDGGMPADALVDLMSNNAYNGNPMLRLFPPTRLTSTMTRFITAAVQTYCPYDQSKITSLMANPMPGPNEPMDRFAAYTHDAFNSGLPHLMDGRVFVAGRYGDARSACDAHGAVLASRIGAFPSGDMTPPDPPLIPPPPPPAAQIQTPPRSITAPDPPKQAPAPPKQAPAPPQQAQPPAVGPQPGGAPAEPPPPPPPHRMPPGVVRLAP